MNWGSPFHVNCMFNQLYLTSRDLHANCAHDAFVSFLKAIWQCYALFYPWLTWYYFSKVIILKNTYSRIYTCIRICWLTAYQCLCNNPYSNAERWYFSFGMVDSSTAINRMTNRTCISLWYIQSRAVITRSTIPWYCSNHCRNWRRLSIRGWTHKNTPYLAPTGELCGVFREYFGENWPRYNSTALYDWANYATHGHTSLTYGHIVLPKWLTACVPHIWTDKLGIPPT